MSSQRQLVTARDLVDEAKKRIVILSICVVGLSYLMSLTSTSVWVNLPAAAFLVILVRYFSLDFEMKRKAAAYNSRSNTGDVPIQEKPIDVPKPAIKKDQWRKKVKSPVVENAIDQFTRHIVSEWVTDLWYSKLTPDRDGPEELVQIINGVLGEISYRMRHINLIDLLARDVLHLICKHLELFRACQAKIMKNMESLSFEQRDIELKAILAAQNKLHPLLFSAESEHKVLQHIMDPLISFTFKTEDLQCSFFRYVARELLACAVMRPVLNLVNPRFINERIEQVVISVRKGNQGAPTADNASHSKNNGPSSDDFSPFPDPSVTGVELVELKSQASNGTDDHDGEKLNRTDSSKDPLLSVDARSTRSWSSLPFGSAAAGDNHIERSSSGGEWGDMLEYFTRRKKQALAPEHFENMWSKGRNYDTNDSVSGDTGFQNSPTRRSNAISSPKVVPKQKESGLNVTHVERAGVPPASNMRIQSKNINIRVDRNTLTPPSIISDEDDEEHVVLDETESGSSTHTSSDDEETRVTGLDTPTTKVWDGRTNRNTGVSQIHHPLAGLDGKKVKRTSRGQHRKLGRQQSGRKRSRLGTQKLPSWQEVERTSFCSNDGRDVHPLKQKGKDDDSSDEYDLEYMNRLQSGTVASSSAPSLGGSFTSSVSSPQTTFSGDSFFKLRCEVLGANVVRSSSSVFAVYSISVTDAENNSWSIKRRYRHFEELHRRLKEYPVYCLHLPPKHFLSTGLDVHVIRERCKLLDEYLKKLMQLPTISGSIDVWDFLSIDSQTYTFSSAFSIIETFSVKSLENQTNIHNSESSIRNHLKPKKGHVEEKDPSTWMNNNSADGFKTDLKVPGKNPVNEYGKLPVGSSVDAEKRVQNNHPSVHAFGSQKEGEEPKSDLLLDASDDPTFPSEWVAPNLSGPILDLVDVIFQLQEGAWIRRKAFWVAKQVLQLGMGDALDDWLVEKIQRLRRGSVVASGINRLEQILWPDGIFITKHPKRQKPPASVTPSQSSSHNQFPDRTSSPKEDDLLKMAEEQEKEAMQRAKFVYEVMIDNAPAAVVSLVGSKEYEQCAKDLYYFIQSSVCLKQLIIDLLELVLLHAYPGLDHVFKQLHEEKHKFGVFKPT
ncbi:hypothetical protein RND81_11G122300 [Saponaria officinalis]|uniref:Uncharacterized protein n=1 Tax=Saponaria officinalis TaxID=3572 RepID=A0AAW1HMR9_SAPOF